MIVEFWYEVNQTELQEMQAFFLF